MSKIGPSKSGRKSRLAMFLQWLVNLDGEPKELADFWSRYESYFPTDAFRVEEEIEEVWPLSDMPRASSLQPVLPQSLAEYLTEISEGTPGKWMTYRPMTPGRKIEVRYRNLIKMRDELREVWQISDLRRKQWKLFLLREKFHQMTAGQSDKMIEPPPQCGMDDGLLYLLRVMPRTKICENEECVARYFIASRRTRRTCSPECAGPSRKIYQETRWAERREARNKERRLEYRKAKHGKVRTYTKRPSHPSVLLTNEAIKDKNVATQKRVAVS